jgi:hypothetical protein
MELGQEDVSNVLLRAVEELIYSCDLCNTARHLCPGCGADVSHGCTTCVDCETSELMTPAEKIGEAIESPVWVLRTMVDVRTGDEIRLGGVKAAVESATCRTWHAVAGANVKGWGDKPKVHDMVHVRLHGRDKMYQFDPTLTVEIQLTAAEVLVIETLGWDNRVQLTSGLGGVE